MDPLFQKLSDFTFEKVLDVGVHSKTCSLLVKSKDQARLAIIFLEKTSFDEERIQSLLEQDTPLQMVFQNDIYSQHLVAVAEPHNEAKVTVIYPCTDKHVRKYSRQALFCVRETAEDYKTVTEPFLLNHQFDMKVIIYIYI